jgi:rhamnulokinase
MSGVVAAVDCGATSVRVCRVDLDAPTLEPDVVHRVAHAPWRDEAGQLRWDWDTIVAAVVGGLEQCLDRGPLASIGVDTWAIDYGLLDDRGRLLGAPYCYRDRRTDGYLEIVDAVGAAEMYRINGLQLQPFNTIFQLAVHDPDEVARAARVLWLPELIVHALTGVAVTERTSAGSSGLVDLATGDWSPELLAVAGVDRAQVGEIEAAARVVGEWRGVPVTLVGGHDTASAVAGMGTMAPGGSAFVASGTWMLVGIERPAPDISEWARQRNFTNEAGVLGGFRFLRNVTGFWLLEQCRPAWGDPDLGRLLAAASAVDGAPIVDVDHDELRAPADMLVAYTDLAGLSRDSAPEIVVRSIVESIAARVAEVIAQLGDVAAFDDVVLFGGAARIELLVRRLGELTGRTVRTGSAEAAALGNAIVQGIALGTYTSLDDGRRHLATGSRQM